jgi:pantoate--beta-alanine ligase
VEVVTKIPRMRAVVDELRRQGRRVGFVPTMGALHEGHLSLVRLAKQRSADVVASIFVNPKQFGPAEDLATYPRDLVRDCELLVREGVASVFAPDGDEMYPPGFATAVEVRGLSDILVGERRPGHFAGVTTVVLKLLDIVRPDFAVFGWKDAQQLVIVQRMVRDLDLPVEIVGAPTVREADGVAASSRNLHLDEPARRAAAAIHRSLQEAIRLVESGERSPQRVEEAVRAILEAEPLLAVDSVKAVGARDLAELKRLGGLVLVLVSVRVTVEGRDPVVLIDNVRIEVQEEAPPKGSP